MSKGSCIYCIRSLYMPCAVFVAVLRLAPVHTTLKLKPTHPSPAQHKILYKIHYLVNQVILVGKITNLTNK